MRRLILLALASVSALLLIAAPASAVIIVDYVGFGWEFGGLPPSDPGDQFEAVAVATSVAPVLNLDLNVEEVTIHVFGLTSTGAIIDGLGNQIIDYVGGWLEVYRDPSQNADWGVFPPNATAPWTFNDGTLLFQGFFIDFRIVIQPNGAGAYVGTLDGITGDLLAEFCSGCAYTWGGAWTETAGAQIPDGYDVQLDGELDVDVSVGARSTNFSRIKAMYH